MADIVLSEIQRVLVADAGVAAIVSGRVYMATTPPVGESEYPTVTIRRNDVGTRDPWDFSEFPITIISSCTNSDLAFTLSEAVDAALDGTRGQSGSKYWYIERDTTPYVDSDTAAITIHYVYNFYNIRQLG